MAQMTCKIDFPIKQFVNGIVMGAAMALEEVQNALQGEIERMRKISHTNAPEYGLIQISGRVQEALASLNDNLQS